MEESEEYIALKEERNEDDKAEEMSNILISLQEAKQLMDEIFDVDTIEDIRNFMNDAESLRSILLEELKIFYR